jgi:hypothetical protein
MDPESVNIHIYNFRNRLFTHAGGVRYMDEAGQWRAAEGGKQHPWGIEPKDLRARKS